MSKFFDETMKGLLEAVVIEKGSLLQEEKNETIDFVLQESNDNHLVFRFRPKESHCHSFNDKPPKSWKEVYKVYYSYCIFRKWRDGEEKMLFDCPCDECSVIDRIAGRIRMLTQGMKRFVVDGHNISLLNNETFPFGMGVSWDINKRNQASEYKITVFNYSDVGFRFYLAEEKLKEFGLFLEECCEYMLAHGEPI